MLLCVVAIGRKIGKKFLWEVTLPILSYLLGGLGVSTELHPAKQEKKKQEKHTQQSTTSPAS